MHEVQLAPFEVSRRAIRSIGDARLDSLDVSDMLDVVRWPIASVTGKTDRGQAGHGDQVGDGAEALHVGTLRLLENQELIASQPRQPKRKPRMGRPESLGRSLAI